MNRDNTAFDLSKVAGSTYYTRKEGKIIACRFNKFGVQRATLPTDKPHFFLHIEFADGDTITTHCRVLPRIYFTAEDAINNSNCIADLPICGYHRGLANHGHHFPKEMFENGNTAKIGYIWKAENMEAVKIIDLPLYDYVNGTFHASSPDFESGKAMKVYATEEECLQENGNIEVVDFEESCHGCPNKETCKHEDEETPEEEGDKPHIVFIAIGGRSLQ